MNNQREGSAMMIAICFMTIVMAILAFQLLGYAQRQKSYHYLVGNYEKKIEQMNK